MRQPSPFHPGEQAVHDRYGIRERIEQVGSQIIRDAMTEQHRHFFRQLPILLAGSLDDLGRPWASILTGRPGFIESPDPRSLRIAARPLAGDPLAVSLRIGAPLGLLGIEPSTRRRNRLNGCIVAAEAGAFTLGVQQSFGNCPKYIQSRSPHCVEQGDAASRRAVEREGSLVSEEAAAMIDRADTFFIASAAPGSRGAEGAASDGADVSHRGGAPGFVRRTSEAGVTTLTIPDFTGNYLFNTLGNLVAYPRAGLLFVDFGSGDLLGLTGSVDVIWDGPEVQEFAGAQRLLQVAVEEGWRAPAASPLRWSAPEPSPYLDGLGPWNGAQGDKR